MTEHDGPTGSGSSPETSGDRGRIENSDPILARMLARRAGNGNEVSPNSELTTEPSHPINKVNPGGDLSHLPPQERSTIYAQRADAAGIGRPTVALPDRTDSNNTPLDSVSPANAEEDINDNHPSSSVNGHNLHDDSSKSAGATDYEDQYPDLATSEIDALKASDADNDPAPPESEPEGNHITPVNPAENRGSERPGLWGTFRKLLSPKEPDNSPPGGENHHNGGQGGGNGGRPPGPPRGPENPPEPPAEPPENQPNNNNENSNGLSEVERVADALVQNAQDRFENTNRQLLKEIAENGPEQTEKEVRQTARRLMALDALPYDQRAEEVVRKEMDVLYRQMIEYAAREKLQKKSAPIFEAEKAISQHLGRLPEATLVEVQAYDKIEDQLLAVRIEKTLHLRDRDGRPIPFTQDEISDFQQKEQELERQLEEKKQLVAIQLGSGGGDFITQYSNLKNALFAEVSREELKTQDNLQARINFDKPVQVEVHDTLTNENIRLTDNDTFESVSQILRAAEAAKILANRQQYNSNTIHRAEQTIEASGGHSPSNEQIEEAQAKKELFFKEAREISLLDPLTTSINSFYEVVREQWSDPRLEDNISRQETNLINNAQQDRNWQKLLRYVGRKTGGTEGLDRFRGIEVEYIAGAFQQIREMKIDMTVPTDNQSDLPEITRGKFEWDLLGQEKAIQEHRLERERFYEHTYSLQLTGKNKDEIYRGVYNYLDHLTAAGVGDPQHMLQAVELLGNAIDTYGHEHMPQGERNELRRKVENQVYFYMARYFASIAHTDSYIAIMDRWADREGTERMKLVPEMLDGQVGYAISVVEKQNLYWRPEGHRGQVTGNKDAQDYIMKQVEEEMLDEIMKKRIKGYDDPSIRIRNLQKLRTAKSPAELEKLYEDVQFSNQKTEAAARSQARKALEIARHFFDVMGETTELAEPSFVMTGINGEGQAIPKRTEGVNYETELGDLIPESQMARYTKRAILLDAQNYQARGIDRLQAIRMAVTHAKNIARKRWKRRPETEFTQSERSCNYFQAVMAIRKDGFKTVFKGEKFQDIVDIDKHPELDYNPNAFFGIDHPLRNLLAHPELRKLISKGQQPFLHRTIQVLGNFGINLGMNKFQQQEMDNYVNAVEASRRLESDVMKILYAEFPGMDGKGIDYGPANRPLALKRMMKLKGYFMNNLNEKVASAEYIIPWMPVLLKSFKKEVGAKNMQELIASIDVGAFDIYEIQRWLKRIKSVSKIKTLMEGGIDDNFQRAFGILEKPFSTITQAWPIGDTPEHSVFTAKIREGVVGDFLKVIQGRIEPAMAAVFALIDDNRGAAGAGGAKAETTEFLNEYFSWMLSNDGAEVVEGHGDNQHVVVKGWLPREQGGRARYNSQVHIHDHHGKRERLQDLYEHSIAAIEAQYNTKAKIRDEIGRRINQGH